MGAVDELFAFAFPLGESYSGAWADASTFEVAVVVPHYNQPAEASPQVGVSNASFAGGAPLFLSCPPRLLMVGIRSDKCRGRGWRYSSMAEYGSHSLAVMLLKS